MKDQSKGPIQTLLIIFLSWGGTGYAPKAPGTVGSLAAIPFLYWLQASGIHWGIYSSLFIVTLVLACYAAEKIQRQMNLQDPQWIVVDEVLGMWITQLILRPETWTDWGLLFICFRFFDIIKIWPASFFDKKVKNGAGTILDDVVSGVYAAILSNLLRTFF